MAPKTETKTETDADDTEFDASPVKTRSILKKKDFIDRAVEKSGLKKADAKVAVEATLAVLAQALADGDELILPPLGKLKVAREKAHPKGRILMLRLQLASDTPSGSEPLSDAAE